MTGRTTRPRDDDAGSAAIEFVMLGLLLLVPLVYLVLVLARVQAASFAADGAAQAAARAMARADDEMTGRARALAAVRLGLADQGFDDDPAAAAQVACSASPCLTPQGRVSVLVTVRVVLPGLPAVLDRAAGTHVTVRARHVAVVDAFAAGRPAP
jgi:hypothetical protein